MKSVHITNYYHKDSGGISTSYNNLLAAAERHRRFVRLIVPGESETVEEINEFAKIYYVPAKYSPIFDKRYRIMMPWQYMVNDSVIRKILLAEKPDLIEVTDKYTLSLLGVMIRTNSFRKLGRPILVHFSCERMDDNVGSFLIGGRVGKWLSRRVIGNYTLPNFDYHIANSTYTAEEFYESLSEEKNRNRSKAFLNWCWRFFQAPRVEVADRIFVCPRGVNAQLFTPDRQSERVKQEMRERAGVPADSIVLLYAGRISPEKNIGLLVDLMKILSQEPRHDYRLLVAGAGPQSDWLTSHGEKLADYYANADIFVHPNPKEPFGIAPLEAMASGVATVAPNAGGILSYATNENAWLVEPEGASFAAAVREIVTDPDTRARKIARALVTARENTREASTDRLFATYDEIYEHFQKNRNQFVDSDAAKKFDFVKEILNDN